MPAPDFIIDHWGKQLNIAIENLSVLRKHLDTQAIHNLRLAIKKLRSYSKLYSIICNNAEWKNEFIETKGLFSHLGKYRDFEISIELVEKFEKENLSQYSSLLNHLQACLKQLNMLVIEELKKYNEKELNNLYDKIKLDLSMRSAEQLKDNLDQIIHSQSKKIKTDDKYRKDIHMARKSLKDIFYWIKICPVSLFSAKHVKYLDKILIALGDWQDQTVLLSKIEHFRVDFLPKLNVEYPAIKQLEENIKKAMKNYYKI